ncbi:MAG: DivIVA domain-containing protein [Acidimicrobiia bacterium]|nr:DivIVA domain-containing protein [Acidimicrobiia bacterium]
MPLTPIDVQQKTFRVALRGYAEDEVDEFLDEIVLSIREYEQRLEEMSFQVGTLESQLAENRQTEDAMRRTLLLAEKTAGEITDEATREAERLVSDARAEATSLTADQSHERDALIAELARLRDIVSDVQGRLSNVAADTQTRLEPIEDDIDAALADVDDGVDEPSLPRAGGLFAVEGGGAGGSVDETWVDRAGDTAEDDIDDTDYWDTISDDETTLAEDAEADDLVSDHRATVGEEDEEQEVDDTADGLQDPVEDGVDQVEDIGSRRRPWERFGD